jgi:hypothetical protein
MDYIVFLCAIDSAARAAVSQLDDLDRRFGKISQIAVPGNGKIEARLNGSRCWIGAV